MMNDSVQIFIKTQARSEYPENAKLIFKRGVNLVYDRGLRYARSARSTEKKEHIRLIIAHHESSAVRKIASIYAAGFI